MSSGAQLGSGEDWSDRRRAPRFPLQLPVKLHREGAVISGMTEDVSAGGFFVFFHPSTPIDSEIEFVLTLPPEITLSSSLVLKGKATVIRITSSSAKGLGVAAEIDSYEFITSANA